MGGGRRVASHATRSSAHVHVSSPLTTLRLLSTGLLQRSARHVFANRPATGSLSRLMSAPESDSSLYPPKDKKTRRLWHELSTFKKSKEKGSKKNILQLPPANGYMRACAHHFSRLLGLTTETFTEGDTKAVRVRFDLGAADTGTKRKAPDGGFPGDGSEPDGNGPQSGDVAGHGQPSAAMGLTTDGAGTSQKVEESATSEVAAGAAKSGASDSAVQPTRRERAAFSSRLGKCAQTSDAVEATAIFEEMVKTGFTPSADMCATMIHLYSSAPSPMLSEALAVFECARATGGVPKEPVWSGMVKLHCARGDTTAGISYVQQMVAAGIAPRLRTFSPIIAAACNALDTDTARLAVQQAEDHGLTLTVAEHLDLTSLAARAGGAPAVVEALRRMKKDEPLPLAEEHAAQLESILGGAGGSTGGGGTGDATSDATGDGRHGGGGTDGWRVTRCQTDDAGVCSHSGVTLQAVELLPSEREGILKVLPSLIGPKGKANEFGKFTRWLDANIERDGPFDFVLDGANIGFFGHSRREASFRKEKAKAAKAHVVAPVTFREGCQPPEGLATGTPAASNAPPEATPLPGAHGSGAFDHGQINQMIAVVRREAPSARLLLVLHVSHTLPKLLTAEEAEYVERWRREGILCEAPAGMNDDWYWLHAALASGAQCRVISNDEMRDHHFGMMNSSTFLRWKERHIVHFNLPYVEPPARPTPTLTPPRPYSSVMQEHPDGLWHLPCADKIDTWLCLEPPRLEPHSQ